MPIAPADLVKLSAAFAAGGIIGALIGRRRKRTLEGAVIGAGLVGGATLGALAIAGSLGSAIGSGISNGSTITPAQAALTATALLPVVAANKVPGAPQGSHTPLRQA